MSNLLMQLVATCVLLTCIFHQSKTVVVTYSTARFTTDDDFYTGAWNYTVSPGSRGGIFQILKLNLTSSSLIFFNLPYRKTVCPEKLVDVSRGDVVKVYDVTTKIGEGDPPHTFTVQHGNVLCFMKLERRRYGDGSEFVYTYKDDGRSSDVTITHPSSFRYKKQSSIRSVHKEQCINIRDSQNLAFEMIGGMSDKKSLNNVRVFYIEPSYRYSDEESEKQKTVIRLTSRTPETSYKRLHVLTWGYRSGIKRICFAYEVVNGSRADYKDDVTFIATEYRSCNGNMTVPRGLFSTERYPSPLYGGLNCTKHITALPGQRIALSFLDAKIDCHHGFVMLRGLQNRHVKNDMKLLCGGSLESNSTSYISESNTLSVQVMNKGYKKTDRGYFASYTAIGCGLLDAKLPPHSRILNDKVDYIPPGFKMRVGCEEGYIFPTMESEMTLECGENGTWSRQVPICVEYPFCNTTMTASNGIIQSPSYPNAFTKDTTCVWKIQVREGQNIKVTIMDLSAFCHDNFLYLDSAAKGSPGEPYQQVLCSNGDNPRHIGESFYTVKNELNVMFQSNFLKDSGYFKIKYEATGCSLEEFPTHRYKITMHYYNGVGSQLVFKCPLPRQYFTTGESERYLTCGADGTLNGTYPLCAPQQTD